MCRLRTIFITVLLVLAFGISGARGQVTMPVTAAPVSDKPYDHHDLSGVWRLPMTPKSNLHFDSTMPEPALTQWGQDHIFPGGITHGPHITVSGGFPGQNCDPIGVPAQFAYLRFYPLENIQLPGRIIQMFEDHREWRNIAIGQDHPKDLNPTYMGNSVGKWEGDTLVVDTIGFNGKLFVTEDVDHPMSKEFHLVERYTRTDYNTLKIELSFSDPKVWGDKSWSGFTRILKLQQDQLQEWICVPEVDSEFNRKVMAPTYGSQGLNMPKDQPK
jgi:hypothetical protein